MSVTGDAAFLPQGTVYGTLLNFRSELETLGAKMSEPPYLAPPRAPVLYIKPANTWSADGTAIAVPGVSGEVEIGATIGMVMRSAGQVGGYVVMNDLSLPHASFFRPPVKFKCRDGFLGVGPRVLGSADAGDPARFRLEVRINGELKQIVAFADLVRDGNQLLADVSEFMTLHTGDVLMLGCDAGRPLARAGDRIEISAPGFAPLRNTLVAEAA